MPHWHESQPLVCASGAATMVMRVSPLAPLFRRATRFASAIGARAAGTARGILRPGPADMPLAVILPNVIVVACTAGLIWLVVRAFRRR